MATEAPLQINATLTAGDSGSWSCLYRALTEEEMLNTTMYAHSAFARVADEWLDNNPIQVSVINKKICVTVATLEDDGDNVLEFEVPLADVILTAIAWEGKDAALLAPLLRQLADKLEAAS